MVTLEYFYTQLINPRLNLAYVTQNVSQKISGEADLPDVIHAENRSALDRLTAADEELWQLANSELDRRIGMVPDFEQRLEDFRRRCDEMRTAYSASQRDGTGQS